MKGYRADIDGLRAIAVLCVLFFHLDIALFSGGFIGVDVFFTISGFLITGIVIKEHDKGLFSFTRFYTRRALRLLPAYLFLLLVSLLVGMILLTPIAYKELISSAIASSLFSSNMYFLFTQGGYFSNAAHELPLLHTWSLSVEEQFYLIMPITLLLWLKIRSESKRLWTIFICLIISITFSYVLTEINQKVAYFFVISRAYEFLVGSVLAVGIFKYSHKITPTKSISNIIFVFSMIVLLLTSIYINSKTAFPSITALIPCFATVLLIYSGLNVKCISHKVLGNRLLVQIGLLSYSLYLWHWPIISYAKFIGFDFTVTVQLVITTLSFMGAYVSWRFVEKKVRYANWGQNKRAALSLYVFPCLLLFGFYLVAKQNEFFPKRFTPQIVNIEAAAKSKPELGRESCHTSSLNLDLSDVCKGGDISQNSIKAVLWGDSHANHFIGFLEKVGALSNIEFQSFTMGNCPPLPDVFIDLPGSKNICREKNNVVFNYIIDTKPEIVYLAGSWGGYLDNLAVGDDIKTEIDVMIESIVSVTLQLRDKNIDVVLFKMLPRLAKDLSSCYLKYNMFPDLNPIRQCSFVNNNRVEQLERMYLTLSEKLGTSIRFISVSELFCDNGICNTYLGDMPLYRDNNHLNYEGSKLLGDRYTQLYN